MKNKILTLFLTFSFALTLLHGQAITVTATGVGIGTPTPSEKLEVAGNLKVNDAVLSPTGAAPVFGCRAWVDFDGTRNAAGVADSSNTARYIRGSGNVTSVVKNSTGNYTISFAIPMQDDTYACSICSTIWGVMNQSYLSILQFGSKTASSITIVSGADYPHSGINDKAEVCVTVFQ